VKIAAGIAGALALVCAAGSTAGVWGSSATSRSRNVVVVSNTADSVNGKVSSLSALKAKPGRDGISLREALTAADKTGGKATVYILFSAALNGKTIKPRTPLPSIYRDHLVLEGVAPNGSPARVTLDGRRVTAAKNNQAVLLVRASEVTIRWLRFTGVMPYSNPASQEYAVRVAPGPFAYLTGTPRSPRQIANVQIIDNVFDNSGVPAYTGEAGTNGVTVNGDFAAVNLRVSGVTIARNTFLHFGEGNGEAVGVWAAAPGEQVQGVVIEDNRIDQNLTGIELALGSHAPRLAGTRIIGNTITGGTLAIALNTTAPDQTESDGAIDGTLIDGNVISGVQGAAMGLGTASNMLIVNNVVDADTMFPAGIYMGRKTASSPGSASAVTIENDTFVNYGGGSIFVLVLNQPGANGNDVIIRNSILYNSSSSAASPIAEGGPGNSLPPGVVANSLISGPGWAGSNGNINGDPHFVNEAAGDLHLAPGSPAINSGTTIGAPGDDLDGARRDASPDIGAFEAGAAPRPALTVIAVQLGGSGTVTSSPAGIKCGTVCSARFGPNATVTLTAKPGTGSRFLGWQHGCSGKGRCTIKLTNAKSVTARFAAK
jgi:hypothetical protein